MQSSPASELTTPRPADVDVARLLTLVERTVTARLADVLKAHGGTVDEWRVLSLLGDGQGHPMSEIADFTMLQAPTLTKIVDRMVAANLVLRRPDETDRRRVLVFSADRGRQAHSVWSDPVRATQDDLVAAVGPEETALLKALLLRAAPRLGLVVRPDPPAPTQP